MLVSPTEVLDDYLITLNVHWSKQEGRALIRSDGLSLVSPLTLI
jgi:hypothetical protein